VFIPVALLDVEDYPEYNGIVKSQVSEITVFTDEIIPLMGICKWPTGHFTEIPGFLPYGSIFWAGAHEHHILLSHQCGTEGIYRA
jgi:hypothetical protein